MAGQNTANHSVDPGDPSEKLAVGVAWMGLVFVAIVVGVVGSQVWRMLGF